jgi:hypothetical protein
MICLVRKQNRKRNSWSIFYIEFVWNAKSALDWVYINLLPVTSFYSNSHQDVLFTKLNSPIYGVYGLVGQLVYHVKLSNIRSISTLKYNL